MREKGICLDDLKFVMPPDLVDFDIVCSDAAEASDISAADPQSLDTAFDACDDSKDGWDAATLGSCGYDEDASPEVTNTQNAPIVWWTQARKALWHIQHNYNTWTETVSLRDAARLLALDEAVIWFDTDGQAPAHVRLERYTKPLVDLSTV